MSLPPTSIAIISAGFGAVANILARTLLKGTRAQDMLSINFLTMAATLLLVSPLFYSFHVTLISGGLVLLVGFIDSFANYFYFKTFEKTEASIATPLLSLAPAFTFFFGFIFLKEGVSVLSYISAFLIIVLILVFSVDFKNFKAFRSATLLPGITASFLFGISAIPTAYLLNNLHALNAPTLYMFRAGLIGLFGALFFRFPISELKVSQYRTIFIRSLIVIAQWVLLYYALTTGSAGVTVTLGNITPIFVFFLSMIFLHEKPTWKKSLTAILILILSFLIH